MILNQKDKEAVKRYNSFVRNSPYARFNQDINWASVKENWIPEFVYIERDNEIVAALSILMIEAIPGRHFMYAARGPVCDFEDTELVQELIEATEELKEKYNPFLLRMDPEVPENDELVNKYREMGYTFRSTETDLEDLTQPRYNMILNLESVNKDSTEDEIYLLYRSSTRRKMRSSYRKGVETTYEVSSEGIAQETIDNFYELTKIMAERQGITHRPKDYFVRLLDAFPDSRVYETYYNDELVASSIAISYGEKTTYLYAASGNKYRNIYITEQMIHEQVKWAISEGKKAYDFGGVFEVDNDNGLYRFKKGFTGEEGLRKFIGELDVVYDEEAYQEFIK